MKAISLYNPYAVAIALGLKKIETRPRRTHFRGDLVICSAKRPMNSDGFELADSFKIHESELVYGYALCVVDLYECIPAVVALTALRGVSAESEIALGDYSHGRYAWLTRNCRKLKVPVPVIGHQGFWNLPAETVADIKAQL
jgi:hypothetical protein